MYITKWGITRQPVVRINWNFETRRQKRFSYSSLKLFGPWAHIFDPRPFIVESLKVSWDQQSLIEKQNFVIANYTSFWTFNIQSFVDSDKYLLSYSTLINPLEPDVHNITSQILSVLIEFYPDLCTIFQSFFPSVDHYNFRKRKDIKKR